MRVFSRELKGRVGDKVFLKDSWNEGIIKGITIDITSNCTTHIIKYTLHLRECEMVIEDSLVYSLEEYKYELKRRLEDVCK